MMRKSIGFPCKEYEVEISVKADAKIFSLVCVCVCVCVCDSHAGCNLSFCLSWYAFQLNSTCTLGFVVVASLIYIAARKPLAMSLSSPHCLVSRVPSFLRQWMV